MGFSNEIQIEKLVWQEPLLFEPSCQPYMFLLYKNSVEKTGWGQTFANDQREVVTMVLGYVLSSKLTGLCALYIDSAFYAYYIILK